jgi:hypothetical protein
MGRITATKRESIYDFGDTLGAFRKGKSRGMDFFSPYMSRTIVYSAISEWVRHLLLHLPRVPCCCRGVFLRICKSLSFNELHIKCDKLGTFQKRGKQYNCDKLGDFWKRELKVIRTQIWNIRSKNETNMRSMRVISQKNKLGLLRQKMSIENYSRKKRKGQVRQIRNIFARTGRAETQYRF